MGCWVGVGVYKFLFGFPVFVFFLLVPAGPQKIYKSYRVKFEANKLYF